MTISIFEEGMLPDPSTVLDGTVYGIGAAGGPFVGTLQLPVIPTPITGVMNFRVVNQAIIDTLGVSAGGQYTVVGYQRQGKDASEVRGSKRLVQSYFSNGEFSKSGGRSHGSAMHALTFTINLTVSAAAKADLTVINNPQSTPTQVSNAIKAMTEAAYEADILLDELAELVYQVLMDGRNIDLGLPKGTISSRWLESIQKNDPLPQGGLVVLTGAIRYTCNTIEQPAGDLGTLGNGITTTIDIEGDTVGKAGVSVNTGGN